MSAQKTKAGENKAKAPLADSSPTLPDQGIRVKPKSPRQPSKKVAGKPKPPLPPTIISIAPVAKRAKLELRHILISFIFLFIVVLPLSILAHYLYTRAEDQYVSNVGFTVQTEEIQSPLEILGGLGGLSGSGSSDADILFKFIHSQGMVQQIDKELNLRSLYSKPEDDPIFSFDPDGSIEDLVEYWQSMVRVNYDAGTKLVELEVRAFSAQDAFSIANAIFDECSKLINSLSAIAQDDTTRYSLEELEKSVVRIKKSRQDITQFRIENQIADPSAELGVQAGLMNALQQRLSDALIEADMLKDVASESDPRVELARRKIEVIRLRIVEERKKFGNPSSGQSGADFSRMIGKYESLIVDREFAEKSYLASLAAYDIALAEANRKTRYLAAYIEPTLAERALHPRRELLLGLAGLILFISWSIITLTLYSIRDRR